MKKLSFVLMTSALSIASLWGDHTLRHQILEDIRVAPTTQFPSNALGKIGSRNLTAAQSPHAHDRELLSDAYALTRIHDIRRDVFEACKADLAGISQDDLRQAIQDIQTPLPLTVGSPKDKAFQGLLTALTNHLTDENQHLFPQEAKSLKDDLSAALGQHRQGVWQRFYDDFVTHKATLLQVLQDFMGIRTKDDDFQDFKNLLVCFQIPQGRTQNPDKKERKKVFKNLKSLISPLSNLLDVDPTLKNLKNNVCSFSTKQNAALINQNTDIGHLKTLIEKIDGGQDLDDQDLESLGTFSLILSFGRLQIQAGQNGQRHLPPVVTELQNLLASVSLNYEQSKKVLLSVAGHVDTLNPRNANIALNLPIMDWQPPQGYSLGENCTTWQDLIRRRIAYTEQRETSLGQDQAFKKLLPMAISIALSPHADSTGSFGFHQLLDVIKPENGSTLSAVSVNMMNYILSHTS